MADVNAHKSSGLIGSILSLFVICPKLISAVTFVVQNTLLFIYLLWVFFLTCVCVCVCGEGIMFSKLCWLASIPILQMGNES